MPISSSVHRTALALAAILAGAALALAPAVAAPPAAVPAKPAAASPGTAAKPVFPDAVSPKYAKEAAGKARMHTCRDQYDANKKTNANGGLKWIAKGGGYYAECNKHLKG